MEPGELRPSPELTQSGLVCSEFFSTEAEVIFGQLQLTLPRPRPSHSQQPEAT